jgi:glycosyltransferase involved in cell wall biosynthesis
MRVLSIGSMYPPHALGGYEVTWASNVAWLRARRHDVTVLCSDVRFDAAGDAPDEPGVRRDLRWWWHEHAFPPTTPRERVAVERHNRGVLRRALRDVGPDVVVWWAMGGMSLSLVEQVRRAGLPAVGMVGDLWPDYGPRVDAWLRTWAAHPRLAWLAERVVGVPARVRLDAAAEWVFVSEWARERTARAAGWSVDDAAVASPGVDLQRFTAAGSARWEGRLLCVGRIDERKGLATALGALALLPAATLRVVGAGDDAHLRDLHALAATLGVAERVRFDGPAARDDLRAVYADADAVLFPVTWPEPWGLVPLEAMAVGRPVLATGTGGSGDYLQDGANALLHPPGDARALAATVERLAADPALRSRLTAVGQATAQHFSEERWNATLGAIVERAGSDVR